MPRAKSELTQNAKPVGIRLIPRHKAETLQANVLSNMYPQYRFGPKGRIYNVGLTEINIPQTVGTPSPTAKNGSIVKAIKNL